VHAVLIGFAVAAAIYVLIVVVLLVLGRGDVAREAAALLPNLLSLFGALLKDPRVPRASKILVLIGAVWVASPIDLIPEFIPILGPLDDAVVAALVLRHLFRTAGNDVVAAHWKGDPATLARLARLFQT
jgi:uncharacterized membrane protein YkvA (DUF1232 family)